MQHMGERGGTPRAAHNTRNRLPTLRPIYFQGHLFVTAFSFRCMYIGQRANIFYFMQRVLRESDTKIYIYICIAIHSNILYTGYNPLSLYILRIDISISVSARASSSSRGACGSPHRRRAPRRRAPPRCAAAVKTGG